MQEISRQLTNLTQALSQAPTAPAPIAPAPTAPAPISQSIVEQNSPALEETSTAEVLITNDTSEAQASQAVSEAKVSQPWEHIICLKNKGHREGIYITRSFSDWKL